MPRNYRVAVIGHTGRGNYGHGLDVVWSRFNNVQMVAVADADKRGLAAAQQRIKARNAYLDYREMLKKERPQIVAVAARHLDQHRDMVLACAEAGAHIYMEKPMCRTLAEADEMVTACEKHHVKLAISHQTRYSPRIQQVRNLIAEGSIGDILEMRARGKEDSRGGGVDMMVLGSHLFDLMRLFAGDARWCYSRIGIMEKEGAVRPATDKDIVQGGEGMGPIIGNHITAMYGFDKGIVGHFDTHRANRRAGERNRFGLQIYGSRGVIQLVTGSLPPTYLLADPSWFPASSRAQWQLISSQGLGKPETLQDGGLVQGNEWIIQDLFEAIEKDRQPKCSVYDGRGCMEMILAPYASYRARGPVNLPSRNRQHPLAMK